MQLNDLYCLARSQIHTLSCGVAHARDFDEHVGALEYTIGSARRWVLSNSGYGTK